MFKPHEINSTNIEKPLLEKIRNIPDRITDIKELDKPLWKYVEILDDVKIEKNDIALEGVHLLKKRWPIEGHGGTWEGEAGNSTWNPDKNEKPKLYNPDNLTWEEIFKKYGIDGIEYKDGEPDFSPISKGDVEIDDFTDDRSSNFTQADEALAKKRGCSPEEVKKWREENGYTWHECSDCKTMQKVPREVHNNMPHSGGVSEYKERNKDQGES